MIADKASAFFLEMLNGGAITPELIWLVLLTRYLVRESHRRGLHAWDWFKLPPSMNLMLAIFIVDSGTWIRSVIIWLWRRNGAGDFNDIQVTGLMFGGALIVLGFLCKIRALTKPDEGDRPWLRSAAISAVALITMLAVR